MFKLRENGVKNSKGNVHVWKCTEAHTFFSFIHSFSFGPEPWDLGNTGCEGGIPQSIAGQHFCRLEKTRTALLIATATYLKQLHLNYNYKRFFFASANKQYMQYAS